MCGIRELDLAEFPAREVRLIVIHCSGTPCNVPLTPCHLEQCHRSVGLSGIGFHYYVTRDGAVYNTRPVHEVGAHTPGFNLHSIGICYEGGRSFDNVPCDTRTTFQRSALLDLVRRLQKEYPGVMVKGHRQLTGDAGVVCPCFDAEGEYMLSKV